MAALLQRAGILMEAEMDGWLMFRLFLLVFLLGYWAGERFSRPAPTESILILCTPPLVAVQDPTHPGCKREEE